MRLVFLFVVTSALISLAPVSGAAPEPILRLSVSDTPVIPGQSVQMRVYLLVPTWMPSAPKFPTFEVPNVMVRLPPRSSRPISEQIEGETWSGTSRTYYLHPMVVGRFLIPSKRINVTYADPETRRPRRVGLETKAFFIVAEVPPEAQNLAPFIAANSLLIEQNIEGDPLKLKPGDSITRRVIVKVEGVSPLVIPKLIADVAEAGIAQYPKEPQVSESLSNSKLSGERREQSTYVVEAGGRYILPAIELRWFDLTSQKVETAKVNGIDLVSRGEPLPKEETKSWGRSGLWLGLGVITALLVYVCVVPTRRFVRRVYEDLVESYRKSEPCAYRQALSAMHTRDLPSSLQAIDLWNKRLPSTLPQEDKSLDAAMAALAAVRYSANSGLAVDERHLWESARHALKNSRSSRRTLRRHHRASRRLPPLNPR